MHAHARQGAEDASKCKFRNSHLLHLFREIYLTKSSPNEWAASYNTEVTSVRRNGCLESPILAIGGDTQECEKKNTPNRNDCYAQLGPSVKNDWCNNTLTLRPVKAYALDRDKWKQLHKNG